MVYLKSSANLFQSEMMLSVPYVTMLGTSLNSCFVATVGDITTQNVYSQKLKFYLVYAWAGIVPTARYVVTVGKLYCVSY